MTKLHVSQIFKSFQGEGSRTGVQTLFLRLFGCNLRCPGFFQPDPTNPQTYIKPIDFDPKSIKTLDDLPVIERGCDTLYAIDPRFKHLKQSYEIEELADEIYSYLPEKEWIHPVTKNQIDLCITGGEPLLQQEGIVELLSYMWDQDGEYSFPEVIQIETNGSKGLSAKLEDFIISFASVRFQFNVSLKLFNVSGEDYDWNLYTIYRYRNVGDTNLKIVMNSDPRSWDELDRKLKPILDDYSYIPVYIMPVGATYEQQSDYKEIEKITKMALERGFHISGRLHVITLGNAVDA